MPERPTKRPKEPNFTPDGDATWKQLMEIQKFGYGNSQIFRDFVDIALCALLSFTHNLQHPDVIERLRQNRLEGPYEEEYMRLVRRYRENKDRPIGQRPADYFAQAWAVLQEETRRNGQDILGEIYMREITHGEHGQFFTPVPVSDMMAAMTGAAEGETVADPACGSGRFFISIAKVNPNVRFTGVDVAEVCAKMTVLNMWMFNLNADIYHGNSLSMEMYRMWRVRKGGYVFEVSEEQLRQTESPVPIEPIEDPAPLPKDPQQAAQSVTVEPLRPVATEPERLGQETLFDMTEYQKPRARKVN